jgi:hypothetical protein
MLGSVTVRSPDDSDPGCLPPPPPNAAIEWFRHVRTLSCGAPRADCR